MIALSLAAGIVLLSGTISKRLPSVSRFSLPLLAFVLLAPPAGNSISWNVSNARTTTTEQAAQWLVRNVGPDEPVVVESAFIQLPPRVTVVHVTDLISRTADQYAAGGMVYLVASSTRAEQYRANRRAEQVGAYRDLVAATHVVAAFPPTAANPGPTITVLRVGGGR
jgi:hypothetical protein